jgi:hypothetical protein
MKKSIISEGKIKKFDDVHIKSMNLTGMVYAVKGNDVVVNTVRKGLVKAKLDDLKKIYTDSVNEGAMSDIDIIAKEAKDFKDFVKQFYAEYTNFPKNKESLKWLEDIYKGRTKMEGLERVATALPQTEEESVNEGDEKSPEEILRGLREMAMGDLERIEDYAEMIADRMEEGQELSSWMYSQITLAVDQLNSVHDAMDGNDGVKESVKEASHTDAPGAWVAFLSMSRGKKLLKTFDTARGAKQYLSKNVDKLLGVANVESVGIMTKKDWDQKEAKYAIETVNEEKPGLWANIRAKKARGEKSAPKSSQAYKDAVKAGNEINKEELVKEHKDCGCGCNGVTEGGCNTSLKEEKLNEWRAEEVLQQLGGRKFIAMTGAKNFVKNDKDKSITFKIPRAKDGITHVMITLNASDTYTINFLSIRGNNIKQKPVKGVYNDQLQSVFTQYTGLNTSL